MKRDAKPSVKRACCEILGRIRDPHKDAVNALIEKLKDPDEYGESVAAAAARALGNIGAEAAAGPLLEVLKGRAVDVDKVLKVEAIRSLGILRSADAVELLRKALDDKKTASVAENDDVAPLVAAAAADALGAIRAKEATDDLGAKLADTTTNPSSTQQLGVHAARALQRILSAELATKTEKDDARKGTLTGSQDEITKTLEAWRKWWDGLKVKKDIEKTKADLVKVAAAVEAFKKANGKLPEVLDYLKNKPDYAKDFPKDGYFAGDLKDAWNRAYNFRVPGTGAEFDVFSYGQDGPRLGHRRRGRPLPSRQVGRGGPGEDGEVDRGHGQADRPVQGRPGFLSAEAAGPDGEAASASSGQEVGQALRDRVPEGRLRRRAALQAARDRGRAVRPRQLGRRQQGRRRGPGRGRLEPRQAAQEGRTQEAGWQVAVRGRSFPNGGCATASVPWAAASPPITGAASSTWSASSTAPSCSWPTSPARSPFP
jgi:hypothetical protein